jgi:hypothetical protein
MKGAPERRQIRFEGFTEDDLLAVPEEHLRALVLTGEPLVFRVGSATILGEFQIHGHRLVVELAQIEEGGEGVLLALGSLARRYARLHKLNAVEWIVHAVSCAKPNLKLRRVLHRSGFTVQQLPGIGEAYHFVDQIVGHLKND